MASAPEPHPHNHQRQFVPEMIQSTVSSFFSLLNSLTPKLPNLKTTSSAPKPSASLSIPYQNQLMSPSKLHVPFPFSDSPPHLLAALPFDSSQSESLSSEQTSTSSEIKGVSSDTSSGFPATVRISGLSSSRKGGGPAFVGHVFSMCDLSGTGLMAVSTHFDIPIISKRTPQWIKKLFATINKSERNGPMFRFFMDLGDAVSYVKKLNIPSGVVGACRLDLAYEHFKQKPHLFQFVPNEKQVKAANKLLKSFRKRGGKRRIDGVPVFTAQNLDIAIATTNGVKWYTPYFFDKNMLDNILEESVDQHFQTLIQSRRTQRRRDVIDDNLAAEIIEESGENLWEPPEVQEVLEEMGNPGIPLSVISKAAELQLLYAVDKVLLGNRWLRKATGIQPKFPYVVDSFEKRSAASLMRASESTSLMNDFESGFDSRDSQQLARRQSPDFRFPFGDWFSHPWSKQYQNQESSLDTRMESSYNECIKQELEVNPFLPKITMVGISTGEVGQMSKANLKKTMEDLKRELEQTNQGKTLDSGYELKHEQRDPLFVANVGDYYSGLSKTGSTRWVRGP